MLSTHLLRTFFLFGCIQLHLPRCPSLLLIPPCPPPPPTELTHLHAALSPLLPSQLTKRFPPALGSPGCF